MAKKFDVVAKVQVDGQDKARWVNCGAVFEKEGRLSLKLESLPVGPGWNGWLSLFEPKDRDQAAPKKQEVPKPGPPKVEDFDDAIPFVWAFATTITGLIAAAVYADDVWRLVA